jgi:hypothetical protein
VAPTCASGPCVRIPAHPPAPTRPHSFAAGGDPDAEAAARALCEEAEIATILSDSSEQEAPVYLSSTPKSFESWKTGGSYSSALVSNTKAASEDGAAGGQHQSVR